jgi:acyl-CoA synthetase
MSNTLLTLLSHQRLAETYAAGHWRDGTIYALARDHAAEDQDRPAVQDRHRTLSYGRVVQLADAFARELEVAGLRKGDRVAVWLPSRVETAIALLACSRNGYVCCPSLHRDHTSDEVAGLLTRMSAAAFIGQPGYGEGGDIFAQLRDIGGLKKIVALQPAGNAPENDLMAAREVPETDANTDPNLVVYLAFTSGTTGAPKGVMHSDNTLLANARAMIDDWRFDASSVIYSLSPLSHNLGLGALVMALACGGELVVHDLPRGDSLLNRLQQVDASFIVGVPTHAIDLIAELRNRNDVGPGRIKGFRISGASASPDVIRDLLRFGIVPQSGYGMTEAGSHHYTRIDDPPERIAETSGKACISYEVTIWDLEEPDRQLGPGEEGQIAGYGAGLMLGYFDDQAANEAAFNRAGWFLTGDIGRLDPKGYLTITGRKKDLIIRGGHNIYPQQIESLAAQHPAVERAAAIPVADPRLGEKVCLAVTVGDTAVAADDLLAHLAGHGLSRYDMPEYLLVLDQMPMTASGKILKRDLISRIGEGALSPEPVRWNTPSDAAD